MLSPTALIWNWVAAGFAIFLAVNFAYAIWKERSSTSSSLHWPVVKGEIVACEVKVPVVHSSDDEPDCGIALSYRYRVDGKEHKGSRIHASREASMTRQAAEELAARYPVGATVDVHYRADRPQMAVLEPKGVSYFGSLVVFLAVALCVATVLVAHGIAGKVLYLREGGVPLWAFLLPLACFAVAALGVYEHVRLRRLLHESVAWPVANGRISALDVVEEQETSRDDNGRETTSIYYRPDIRFSYAVGGRELHSSQWKWGATALYGDEERAAKILARYAVGMAVPVHYDPQDPSNAVLEPANRQGTSVPLIFAIVFGGGGVLMSWVFPLLHQ